MNWFVKPSMCTHNQQQSNKLSLHQLHIHGFVGQIRVFMCFPNVFRSLFESPRLPAAETQASIGGDQRITLAAAQVISRQVLQLLLEVTWAPSRRCPIAVIIFFGICGDLLWD
jgi:hypothetical protein